METKTFETSVTDTATSSENIERGTSVPVRSYYRVNDNMQQVTLIWLDSNIDESSSDFQNALRKLKTVIHQVETFKDIDICFNYIDQVRKRQMFMIVSGAIGQYIVSKISELALLERVYIFCNNVAYHLKWAGKVSKIKGVFNNIDQLCKELLVDRKDCEQSAVSITYSGLDPMFLYTQLLKEAVLEISDDLKTSLSDFNLYSQSLGTIDPTQLNEFIRNYLNHTAIWWYTAETFIYPMVNRGFYDMDVGIIQAMAFFIRDLHKHILSVYHEKHQHDRNVFRLYRGQGLSGEAFQKMKRSKGELMSFNNFLSTSMSRDVSLGFALRGASRDGSVGILFEMTIDPAVCDHSNTPFASVAGIGYFDDQEQEILFTTHTVFRIKDIKRIEHSETDKLYQVNITLAGNEDEQFKRLTDKIAEEIKAEKVGWTRFGLILLKLNQCEKGLLIFKKLLEKATNESETASAAFHLGYSYYQMSDHVNAIKYFEQAVMDRKTTSEDDHKLISHYMAIGAVYKDMQNYQKALVHFEKSLDLMKKLLPKYHPDFAGVYNNIGIVYKITGQYKKAMEYYEKALLNMKNTLPDKHPNIAGAYMNIANLYDSMGDYNHALEYHEKSLEIVKRSLPSNHPGLAFSYANIGLCYEHQGNLLESLKHVEEARRIFEGILPKGHPHIEKINEDIERILEKMK